MVCIIWPWHKQGMCRLTAMKLMYWAGSSYSLSTVMQCNHLMLITGCKCHNLCSMFYSLSICSLQLHVYSSDCSVAINNHWLRQHANNEHCIPVGMILSKNHCSESQTWVQMKWQWWFTQVITCTANAAESLSEQHQQHLHWAAAFRKVHSHVSCEQCCCSQRLTANGCPLNAGIACASAATNWSCQYSNAHSAQPTDQKFAERLWCQCSHFLPMKSRIYCEYTSLHMHQQGSIWIQHAPKHITISSM